MTVVSPGGSLSAVDERTFPITRIGHRPRPFLRASSYETAKSVQDAILRIYFGTGYHCAEGACGAVHVGLVSEPWLCTPATCSGIVLPCEPSCLSLVRKPNTFRMGKTLFFHFLLLVVTGTEHPPDPHCAVLTRSEHQLGVPDSAISTAMRFQICFYFRTVRCGAGYLQGGDGARVSVPMPVHLLQRSF